MKRKLDQGEPSIVDGVSYDRRAEKTVTINQPVEKLYQFWRNFENLPKFMRHLKSIQVNSEVRSHWIVDAPFGKSLEWDADITTDQPNQLIAWKTTASTEADHAGFVRFQPAPTGRGTEVKVVVDYDPPGGAIGETIAKIFGKDPEQQLGDELSRLKMLMEAGEIATTEGQPKGQ